ncbi:MAG: GNAT family N-acetyltransferase [Salinicola sp.]|uniref:GNAT family N-acetyltransferase n=1 Tax=uncultured Salinicola sp. TaxID=1193542 RepID=UPI000C8F943A|nr:GNAT family N-acetyltransferase [uncultured Salinicola sp.]MAM58708.1 GNAT family N-acetyltransferase [Salinicola sp.]
MPIQVREARETDIGEIFAIRTSVAENHLSLEQLAELGITPEAIAAEIAQGPCVWVAEIDEAPVGFSMVRDETGYVFGLFVRTDHEGLGVGRLLLERAERHLFAKFDEIWLETEIGSRAYAFYERAGWLPVEKGDRGLMKFVKVRSVASDM